MNFKKKLRIYSRALKRRTIGLSYGDTWQGKDNQFYEDMYKHGFKKNEDFIKYLQNKSNVKSILEIGCGTGVYPIKYKELFENKEYCGIDVSKSAIKYCKKNSKFDFICGDYTKLNLDKKFDLVFSHGVINHIPDIELFFKKIIEITKKFAYIQASHGYFPDLEEHRMVWAENEGIYNTDLSVKQTNETLKKYGLEENEFVIRSQETGSEETSTVIEITRKDT
jgi:SAM-dependent methyltransferase